ncbi:MAG: hypothetical protein GY832_27585 [Chloroflexi bacterium]|nr:hypothetical protein [Chloroflexota bacterium]
MFKKVSLGILAVMVVALGITGIVAAQEPTPPTDGGGRPQQAGEDLGMRGPRGPGGQPLKALAEALDLTVEEVQTALGESIVELAEAQGMSLDDLVDALTAPMLERIQQAVDDGRITQEQADERIAQIEEHMLKALESGSLFGSGPGQGRGGPGGGRRGGPQPEVLAEALGLTVEELHEALSDGQTVAELAEAQGVAMEDLVDALMAPMLERIQQAVDEGRITQEQADEQIIQMEEHILQMLESGPGQMQGGPRDRSGGMNGGPRSGNGNAPGFPGQAAPSADL